MPLQRPVIESEVTHPQMAGSKGPRCAMAGCDGRVLPEVAGDVSVLRAAIAEPLPHLAEHVLHGGPLRCGGGAAGGGGDEGVASVG